MNLNNPGKGPCTRDCTERSALCHITCKAYLEFVASCEQVRKAKQKYYSVANTDGRRKRHTQWLKNQQRKG